jgi:LmbE family N-acetylglucosaminyl deacetylase
MASKKILICVAHPDDETIGCGGTIAKHIKNGDKVFCISMTDGVSSRNNFKKLDIKKRKNSKKKAEKILGFKWIENKKNFPDNQLDTVKLIEIIKVIEKAKKKIKPKIVYTHFPDDLNIDHRLVAEATLTAFRPTKKNFDKILAFEIPSSTDYRYYKKKIFNPNYLNDISKFWKIKKKALLAYKQEMKKFPDSRSIKGIEALAKYRGVQNGLKYAEAFMILKQINR